MDYKYGSCRGRMTVMRNKTKQEAKNLVKSLEKTSGRAHDYVRVGKNYDIVRIG